MHPKSVWTDKVICGVTPPPTVETENVVFTRAVPYLGRQNFGWELTEPPLAFEKI